jgi:hypothetical protein
MLEHIMKHNSSDSGLAPILINLFTCSLALVSVARLSREDFMASEAEGIPVEEEYMVENYDAWNRGVVPKFDRNQDGTLCGKYALHAPSKETGWTSKEYITHLGKEVHKAVYRTEKNADPSRESFFPRLNQQLISDLKVSLNRYVYLNLSDKRFAGNPLHSKELRDTITRKYLSALPIYPYGKECTDFEIKIHGAIHGFFLDIEKYYGIQKNDPATSPTKDQD